MKFIIFNLVPILIILYLFIELILPVILNRPFFWFAKSFRKKEKKSSFEEEVSQAEEAMKEAEKRLEHLLNSATEETEESEKRKKQAQDAFDKAKERLDKLKTNTTQPNKQ